METSVEPILSRFLEDQNRFSHFYNLNFQFLGLSVYFVLLVLELDQTHGRLQVCQELLQGEDCYIVLYVTIQMMKKLLHVKNRFRT